MSSLPLVIPSNGVMGEGKNISQLATLAYESSSVSTQLYGCGQKLLNFSKLSCSSMNKTLQREKSNLSLSTPELFSLLFLRHECGTLQGISLTLRPCDRAFSPGLFVF